MGHSCNLLHILLPHFYIPDFVHLPWCMERVLTTHSGPPNSPGCSQCRRSGSARWGSGSQPGRYPVTGSAHPPGCSSVPAASTAPWRRRTAAQCRGSSSPETSGRSAGCQRHRTDSSLLLYHCCWPAGGCYCESSWTRLAVAHVGHSNGQQTLGEERYFFAGEI